MGLARFRRFRYDPVHDSDPFISKFWAGFDLLRVIVNLAPGNPYIVMVIYQLYNTVSVI